MCGKLYFLLAAVCLISAVATIDAAAVSKADEGNTVDTTEESVPDLETRIRQLREKVAVLVKSGKDNEKAFLNMADQVKQMDDKVKNMINRLKKVNAADYLNGGVESLN